MPIQESVARPDLTAACQAAAAHAATVDRDGRFPVEAIDALRACGALGAMVPRSLGGPGVDLAGIATDCRRLGAACASTAAIYAMHQIQVACLLRHSAGQPWIEDFLRRVASEQLLLASITSEEGIGGNIHRSLCAVEPAGHGRFTLTKRATTISYGANADAYLITARRGPESEASDQVLVVMTASDSTLTAGAPWDALGMRGTGSGEFLFEGQGETGQIMDVPFSDIAAMTMLPVAHIVWASMWLGIATDVVARSRAYLRKASRGLGTTPHPALPLLGEAVEILQALDARLRRALEQFAAMPLDLATAAAELPETAEPYDPMAMVLLKTSAADMALRVAMLGMRICGISGFRNNSPYSLGRHLRDLHSAPVMVSNDLIRSKAGQLALLKLPEFGDFSQTREDVR